MKLKIPKDMRGASFPRLLTIELSGFDIDFYLPTLFYKILADGRTRARRANDPTAVARYVDALAKHSQLEGFDDADGRRLLDRLVRTSLVTMGRTGAGSGGREQILSIEPYTALAHKAGFPAENTRLRRADVFIYRVLRDRLGSADNLRNFIADVFGHGVTFGQYPSLGGNYDNHTELDTLTRLSLAFLDGFDNTPVGNKRDALAHPACPAHAAELGEDLLRYLFAYHNRVPAQALTYYLLGLLNLELFSYTLSLVYAVNTLARAPQTLPPAMRIPYVPAPPQIYIDFTDRAGSLSREMATACVRRDIEAYQQFLRVALLLRQLDGYVARLRRTRPNEVEALIPPDAPGPEYLQGLLLAHKDARLGPALTAAAQLDEDRIREENRVSDATEDEDDADGQQNDLGWLDTIASAGTTDVERVVALLVESQQKGIMGNYMQWYRGVGGLTKPHGILAGDLRGRRGWRYAPSNDLLAILVQLAAVRAPSASGATATGQGEKGPAAIRLTDFLAFLERRFGILVDRPPAPYVGAEAAAAARDNLRAMLGRLRQMGIFRDLSDDFTVQRLIPPYADERAARLEA